MAVTLYENDDFNNYDPGYALGFSDPAYSANLSNYALGYDGNTWDNDTSSLYTTTALRVFEEQYGEGDSALLPPGHHDLADLYSYGIENDDIASFVAVYA